MDSDDSKKRQSPAVDSDDELINNFLNNSEQYGADAGADGSISFGDTVGKADDAIDYEDISDDELPPEEEAAGGSGSGREDGNADDDAMEDGGDLLAGLADEDGNDLDDLFGDMDDAGSVAGGDLPDVEGVDLAAAAAGGAPEGMDFELERALFGDAGFSDSDVGMMDVDTSAQAHQQQLMMMNTIEAKEARARQVFPDFEPHKVLSFSSMFKPKPGMLQLGPGKVPKVCIPTKPTIEMAPDDANMFNKAGHAVTRLSPTTKPAIVAVQPPSEETEEMDVDDKEDDEDKDFATFDADLELACDDWESKIEAASKTPPLSPPTNTEDELDEYDDIISPATKVGYCVWAPCWIPVDRVISDAGWEKIQNPSSFDSQEAWSLTGLTTTASLKATCRSSPRSLWI